MFKLGLPSRAVRLMVRMQLSVPKKPEFYHLRSPYAKWDDRQNRRNFDEPVLDQYDYEEVWTADVYTHTPDKVAVRWVVTYLAGFFGLVYVVNLFWPGRDAMPRNYPYGGLARELGARNEEEAELFRTHVDKLAPGALFD